MIGPQMSPAERRLRDRIAAILTKEMGLRDLTFETLRTRGIPRDTLRGALRGNALTLSGLCRIAEAMNLEVVVNFARKEPADAAPPAHRS